MLCRGVALGAAGGSIRMRTRSNGARGIEDVGVFTNVGSSSSISSKGMAYERAIPVTYVDELARAGRVIGRRYRLERPLTRGLPSKLWRAERVRPGSPVAVRLLDEAIAEDETLLDGFCWEARSAAAVQSPFVARVLDYGVEGGAPYLVTELLDGETLQTRLRARRTVGSAELESVFRQAALGLDEVHALGLIHRDVKPANLFLGRPAPALDVASAAAARVAPVKTPEAGKHESTKLLFGIAKIMNDTLDLVRKMASRDVTPTDTAAYMSPEQVLGRSSVDHRSDLWSLGVIAFECLTGELPFGAGTLGDRLVQICTAPPRLPSDVRPVPAGFDAWFTRAVAKAPRDRPGSALQMADALSAILAR